jgi:predicted RNA methylase
MTNNLAPLEKSTRYTHKATGIIWHYAVDNHTSAPFALQLRNPRRRGPATSHRFVTAGNRDKYVARCIANAQQVDSHVAANFYPTPPEATRALLSVETFDGPIWEPACGQGHIAKVLTAQGHEVIATDLHAWGYGAHGIDFLTADADRVGASARHVITNPPYGRGLADAFIEKALAVTASTGGKVAMLLNLASLAQEQRTPAWQKNPPARLYAIDGVVCWPDPERKPPKHFLAHRYVWAVWEHGHTGPSAFWWLSAKQFREGCTPRRFANATALLMNGGRP